MEWPQFNRTWAICSWSLAVLTSWYKFPYMNIEEQMQLPHNDVGVHQHVEDSRWILTVPLYPKTREGGAGSCLETTKGSCGGQCPSSFRSLFSKTVKHLEIYVTWSTTRFGAGSYSFGSFKSCSCVSCNYISVAHNIASHAVKCDSSVILVRRLSFMVSFSCQNWYLCELIAVLQ